LVVDDAAVLRHQQVGQAVAAELPGRHNPPLPAAADAGLFGHVSECSVAIVPVKRIAERWLGIEEITLAAVDQVNVHPAVVVIIDECASRTHGFRQVHLRGAPVVVYPRNPAHRRRDKLKRKLATALRRCEGVWSWGAWQIAPATPTDKRLKKPPPQPKLKPPRLKHKPRTPPSTP